MANYIVTGMQLMGSDPTFTEQIQVTSAQREQRVEKERQLQLEKVVMEALGGPTARRDSHFKRVMKVISQVIDIDKEHKSEDLLTTVSRPTSASTRLAVSRAASRASCAARPRRSCRP